MLISDQRCLVSAISTTLRIRTKRVREILDMPSNAWRVRAMRGHGLERCAIVPDADDLMIVVYVPDDAGTLRMRDVLKVEPSDLDAWRALPDADRAPPANMPVWSDKDRVQTA